MMRRVAHIGFWLLLPLLVVAGCAREPLVDLVPHLSISLDIPRPALTRADEGRFPSETEAENAINTLQIWVFLSEAAAGFPAGTCIGYIAPDPLFLSDGSENQYALPLNPKIAEAHPDVDVYVLANAASAGHTELDGSTTRAALDALVMTGSFFGLSGNSPACTAVPEGGLPFAGVGKSLTMKGTYPVLSVDSVTLTRTVSKLRFVFSQLADEEGPFNDCSITGIQINGGAISRSEYLFNTSSDPYRIVPSLYESSAMVFPGLASNEIAGTVDPTLYAFQGQTALEYETLIQKGIADGNLTSWGLSYLRETDKQLSGTVSYMLNGFPGSASFTMKDPGDFARNHSWIVYLYFTRDAIQFTVTWTLWDEGHDFILTD